MWPIIIASPFYAERDFEIALTDLEELNLSPMTEDRLAKALAAGNPEMTNEAAQFFAFNIPHN